MRTDRGPQRSISGSPVRSVPLTTALRLKTRMGGDADALPVPLGLE